MLLTLGVLFNTTSVDARTQIPAINLDNFDAVSKIKTESDLDLDLNLDLDLDLEPAENHETEKDQVCLRWLGAGMSKT